MNVKRLYIVLFFLLTFSLFSEENHGKQYEILSKQEALMKLFELTEQCKKNLDVMKLNGLENTDESNIEIGKLQGLYEAIYIVKFIKKS